MLEVHQKDFKFKDDRFITLFHKYVDTDIPLFALQKDMLFLMEKKDISYISIPAAFTKNKKLAIFYFDITTLEKNIKYDLYTFKEVKFYDDDGNEIFSEK